jgi:antitoxin component of MazEF toxin-antitoxin module
MKFTTTILLDGNNTGIEVPEHVMASLGTAKRMPVVVSVGGHTYRSTVTPYKGRLMISLSAANRQEAGVSGGDEVEVDVQLDTAPRTVTVPADLAHALDAHATAKTRFDALSYSNQKRIVLSVESAKTDLTRARRIDAALAQLS